MTTEEFTACLIMRGFSVADFDKFSYGMLLNYAFAYDRLRRLSMGEEIPNPDRRYQKLKQIEPLVKARYLKGEISKDQYTNYERSLAEYER